MSVYRQTKHAILAVTSPHCTSPPSRSVEACARRTHRAASPGIPGAFPILPKTTAGLMNTHGGGARNVPASIKHIQHSSCCCGGFQTQRLTLIISHSAHYRGPRVRQAGLISLGWRSNEAGDGRWRIDAAGRINKMLGRLERKLKKSRKKEKYVDISRTFNFCIRSKMSNIKKDKTT